MRLLDKRSNRVVNVADNLVNDALLSGNYSARPGVRLPVVTADGTFGEIDSEELPKALELGIRYRTIEDDRTRVQQVTEQAKREAYDAPVTAGILGAARGATLGLSDVAVRAIGGESAAEAVRETQEYNPRASLAGEIAGTLASFAVPGGALGAVGRVAGAPTRLATRVGEKAAESVIKTGQQLTTAQKAGRAAIAGATEGAIIGAGQTVSEAALADPELTIQKALSNIGMGALFGGAIGGGGRLAFEGVKTGTTATLSKVGQIEAIPKTTKELMGWVSEKYGALNKIVRGGGLKPDPETDRLFSRTNAEGRAKAVKYIDNPGLLTEEFIERITAGRDLADNVSATASKAAQVQKDVLNADIGKVDKAIFKKFDMDWSDEAELADELGIEGLLYRPEVKGTKLEKAEKSARAARLDAVDSEARALIKRIDDAAKAMQEENLKRGGEVYEAGAISVLDDVNAELSKRFFDETRTITDINNAIVSAKNQLAEQGRIFGRNKQLMSNKEFRSNEKLMSVWKDLKDASVNENLFGDFGAAVAKRAEVLTDIKRATLDFDKQFFLHKDVNGKLVRIPDERAQDLFIRNAGNSANFKRELALEDFKANINKAIDALEPLPVKSLDDEIARLQKLATQNSKRMVNFHQEAGKKRAAQYLDDQIKNMQKQRENVIKFNDELSATAQTAKTQIKQLEDQLEATIEQKLALKILNKLESTTGRSLLGGAAGASIGGLGEFAGLDPVTTPLGGLLGLIVTNPRSAIKYISRIEQAADGFDKMAGYAAQRFKNVDTKIKLRTGVSGRVVPTVRQSLIRDRLKLEDGERHESDEKAFKAHQKKLGALSRDPAVLVENVIAAAGPDAYVDNPRTSIEMAATVQRGIEFLQSKIPKDPYDIGLYPDDEFIPSRMEMSEYADYVQAVTKPKVILKQIAAADINPRTVEAIQAVYPRMYEDLKQQMIGYLMSTKNVPYDQRVQLGYLFGIPSVKAMQTDYLARLATLYNQPIEDEQTTMNRTQLVGIREMQVSQRETRV